MQLRQLTTIDEFRQVVALEHEVWGYTSTEDAVPVPMLIVSAKVGGLVIGAFDESEHLVGFAYSLPGVQAGRPFQWSHMLGVSAGQRDRGVGWLLKLEQRRLTLAMGLDLIEWTFDPLQALNAHLNFVKLGAVANHYERNVYGDSSSPLHQGTPTDRFVAEWWIGSPRVEDRLDVAGRGAAVPAFRPGDIVIANEVAPLGQWIEPVRHDLSCDAGEVGVVIPVGFSEMQRQDVPLARAWRMASREVFEAYIGRGYRVADFALDRPGRRGTYLLVRNSER
jgi:predicted GNAT superfamily acetyltransferase